MRQLAWIIAVTLGLSVAGCGGGGGSSSSSNQTTNSSNSPATTTSTPTTTSTNTLAADATAVPTAVNSTNAIPVTVSSTGISNQPMVSVTVCGNNTGATGNCTTIPNVLVDTGSYGLRLFRSTLSNATYNAMAASTDTNNLPLAECAVFVSAYGWGTVHKADVKLGTEVATAVPVLVMGDTSLTTGAPSACVNGTELTSPTALGANGIIGVGASTQDCGTACANTPEDQFYYTTTGINTTVTLNNQVTNPASAFAQDNNGVILEMAQVSDSGSPNGSGTLVFGIDTESNNALHGTAGATLIPTDGNGNFTATFAGATLVNESFFDSGSTALFFSDSSIPHAGSNESFLYTPSSTVGRTATLFTGNTSTTTVGFNIANAITLTESGNAAFNNIGAFQSGTLDFGLPFFYGRHVYVGFSGKSSAGGGTGPYVAYVSN